jgi:hypothetical protein
VAAAFGLLTRFLLREWQPNAVLVALFAALLLRRRTSWRGLTSSRFR